MSPEQLVVSASVSSLIGAVAPFLMPFVFVLGNKIAKRDLSKGEKRTIGTVVAVLIAGAIILTQFAWTGDVKTDAYQFAQFFLVNFLAIKGMVQVVYELVIKGMLGAE